MIFSGSLLSVVPYAIQTLVFVDSLENSEKRNNCFVPTERLLLLGARNKYFSEWALVGLTYVQKVSYYAVCT